MKLYLHVIILGFIFSLSSCDKDAQNKKIEGLVFGTHSPFCISNCTNLYLYSNDNVYKQKGEARFIEDVVFEEKPLSGSQANSIIDALTNMPEGLFNEDGFLGCPGCVDDAYLYLSLNDKITKIDLKANSTSSEVASWASTLVEAISF